VRGLASQSVMAVKYQTALVANWFLARSHQIFDHAFRFATPTPHTTTNNSFLLVQVLSFVCFTEERQWRPESLIAIQSLYAGMIVQITSRKEDMGDDVTSDFIVSIFSIIVFVGYFTRYVAFSVVAQLVMLPSRSPFSIF
jgi:hypothetical protein